MKSMLFYLMKYLYLLLLYITHLYEKSLLKFVASDIPDHVGFALLGRDRDEVRGST